MTEEVAVRIAEAIKGVDNSIRLIAALIAALGFVFFVFFIYYNEKSR